MANRGQDAPFRPRVWRWKRATSRPACAKIYLNPRCTAAVVVFVCPVRLLPFPQVLHAGFVLSIRGTAGVHVVADSSPYPIHPLCFSDDVSGSIALSPCCTTCLERRAGSPPSSNGIWEARSDCSRGGGVVWALCWCLLVSRRSLEMFSLLQILVNLRNPSNVHINVFIPTYHRCGDSLAGNAYEASSGTEGVREVCAGWCTLLPVVVVGTSSPSCLHSLRRHISAVGARLLHARSPSPMGKTTWAPGVYFVWTARETQGTAVDGLAKRPPFLSFFGRVRGDGPQPDARFCRKPALPASTVLWTRLWGDPACCESQTRVVWLKSLRSPVQPRPD